MDIDFVVTWVDMDDPSWKEQFRRYSGRIDNSTNQFSEARFRDYGLLRYWFRGVERFAPWVRKVHFVTCGQKPAWLDETNPKLHLVDHRDYIPEKFLPVFNSSLIELYLHRIPGLADHFVYFNDDSYLVSPTPRERFFVDGKPCDIAVFRLNTGASLWSKCLRNNLRVINSRFDKKEVQKEYHDLWFNEVYGSKSCLTRLLRPYGKFITLRIPHNAQPYLKSTFEEVWEYAGAELERVSANRFRSPEDYTQELFRTWQICRGNFVPYDTYTDTRMFPLVLRPGKAAKAVRSGQYKLLCLNDNIHIRNYEAVMQSLKDSFEAVFPGKSSFEKDR
jgi:hypothetical protein